MLKTCLYYSSSSCILFLPFLLLLLLLPKQHKQDQTMQMCESLPHTHTYTHPHKLLFVKWIRVDRCEQRCLGLSPRCIIAAVCLCGTQSRAFFQAVMVPQKLRMPSQRKDSFPDISQCSVPPLPLPAPLNFGKVSPFSRPA